MSKVRSENFATGNRQIKSSSDITREGNNNSFKKEIVILFNSRENLLAIGTICKFKERALHWKFF